MSNIRYLKRGKQGDEDVYVTCEESEASHFEVNGYTHPMHNKNKLLQNVTKVKTTKEETVEPMEMPLMNWDEKKEDKADELVGNEMPKMDFS